MLVVMRRATITIESNLEKSLQEYLSRQDVPPTLTTVMQVALREFLSRRGFSAPAAALEITPAQHGSGSSDGSVRHDEYLSGVK